MSLHSIVLLIYWWLLSVSVWIWYFWAFLNARIQCHCPHMTIPSRDSVKRYFVHIRVLKIQQKRYRSSNSKLKYTSFWLSFCTVYIILRNSFSRHTKCLRRCWSLSRRLYIARSHRHDYIFYGSHEEERDKTKPKQTGMKRQRIISISDHLSLSAV